MKRHALITILAACAVMVAAPSTSQALMRSRAATCPGAYVVPSLRTVVQARIATQCLINYERARYRLRRLVGNAQLGRAALGHSQDMVARNYFSHDTYGGGTFLSRILAAGYMRPSDAYNVGENLGRGTMSLSTPAAMVGAWMRSPHHRRNVLLYAYHDIGAGIVLSTNTYGQPSADYSTEFGRRG